MGMQRIATALGIVSLVVGAQLATAQTTSPAPAPPAPPPFSGTELADGPWDYQTAHGPIHAEIVARVERPWGMAFLPDGGMLVTERTGKLRHIRADGTLVGEGIAGLPAIYTPGIAGLNGIALDPDFASNRLLYIAYSKPHPVEENVSTLAVLRARWDGGARLSEVRDIFVARPWYGAMPLPERCCGQGPAFGSYGGRLLFGPDGYLYVTSGDRNYGELVAARDNHLGKILRLDRDGNPAPGNPWAGQLGAVAEAWSTGHRNPLGLAINPFTGELWESEFGPRGGDEVNRIIRDGDYGWMAVTQGQHYNNDPVQGVRNVPGKIDPVLVFGPPSFNPGNLAFYRGGRFPGWEGDLLLASFTHGLLRYDTDAQGMPLNQPELLLRDLGQRWRDVQVGPDGAVYLLTDQTEGAVIRLTPGG